MTTIFIIYVTILAALLLGAAFFVSLSMWEHHQFYKQNWIRGLNKMKTKSPKEMWTLIIGKKAKRRSTLVL
jgi:hypothetical protein